MTRQAPLLAAIFDVGGVLVTMRPDPREIALILGLNATPTCIELVDHALWAHRQSYDEGCSDREFWDRVAGDCALGEISEETLAALVAADVSRMHSPNPGAIALAQDLKDAGLKLMIVSNAAHSVGAELRKSEWVQELFDEVIISAEVGVCKPRRAIYRKALDTLNIPPQSIAFVDDRAVNRRAAKLLGIHPIPFDSADTAREAFISAGVLRIPA
ncbi:MAG: HAD family phosphatase [Actinomycetaceae bacterium]|nr:HAD family phosphatase [Actinomycetaceae bacterium]